MGTDWYVLLGRYAKEIEETESLSKKATFKDVKVQYQLVLVLFLFETRGAADTVVVSQQNKRKSVFTTLGGVSRDLQLCRILYASFYQSIKIEPMPAAP